MRLESRPFLYFCNNSTRQQRVEGHSPSAIQRDRCQRQYQLCPVRVHSRQFAPVLSGLIWRVFKLKIETPGAAVSAGERQPEGGWSRSGLADRSAARAGWSGGTARPPRQILTRRAAERIIGRAPGTAIQRAFSRELSASLFKPMAARQSSPWLPPRWPAPTDPGQAPISSARGGRRS